MYELELGGLVEAKELVGKRGRRRAKGAAGAPV
jgi:hypothetical protein